MRLLVALLFPALLATAQDADPVSLVAAPTLPGLTVSPGSEVTIFADFDKQQVTSPTALCIDEQGLVLVTESHRFAFGVEDNRQHRYWLLDDIASRTTADRRALHEKWNDRTSIASLSQKSEKIRVLTDANRDGVADQSKVFAEGFDDVLDGTAAGIFSLDGNVYFACIPHIWVLQDTDGDKVADFQASMFDGFGVRVSLSGHDLNGFALGPDGRLYGTLGDRGMNVTTEEGHVLSYPDQGVVFRFDPDGSHFEVIHTGLRNPKEIAFDKWGNPVSVDNNSDQGDKARLVYIVDGGDSGWRTDHQNLHTFHRDIGYEKRPIGPWMQERMWEPACEGQPAYLLPPVANITTGPSGLSYQTGTGFANNCEDSFLVCDYRGAAASSGIWAFSMESDGAGMKIVNPRKWLWGVAATDVEFGYDGRTYITDFVGGWTAHEAGRVLTVSSPESRSDTLTKITAQLMAGGFENHEAQSLFDLLAHNDQRVRLRAGLALSRRPEALELFTKAAREGNSQLQRLHGTWGLWMLARREQSADATKILLGLLGNPDAEIRAQAARSLGEAPLNDHGALSIALRDPANRVKAFAALALARHRATDSYNAIVTMLAEDEGKDLYLRHAGIMGLLGCGTPAQLVALKDSPIVPLRLAAVVALRRLGHPGLVQFLFDKDPSIADEAIRAIHDVPIEAARPAVAALLDDYAPGQPGRPLSRMQLRRIVHSAFRVGTPDNAARLLGFAANPEVDLDERLEALRLLALWTKPPTVDQSLGRHAPLAARDAADILPVLESKLGPLLETKGPILTAAIDLIGQYGVVVESVDDDFLVRIATGKDLGPTARARALQMLSDRKSTLAPGLLDTLVDDPDDLVASQAVSLIVANRPDQAIATLGRVLKSARTSRKQSAWRTIQSIPGPKSAELIINGLRELTVTKSPLPYALEIVATAEARAEPHITDALSRYRASLSANDPLAAWQVALRGGDPGRGADIFHTQPAAQCLRCHRIETTEAEGGQAGPNLAGIGRDRTAVEILKSIIDPNANISPGFGTVTLDFHNGGSLSGILQTETKTHLDLLVGTDLWKVDLSDVKERSTPVSAMPLIREVLPKSDIRDLVAFLTTLKEKPPKTTSPGEAKPFDPDTIKPTADAVTATPDIDPAFAKLGKQSYALCMGCHGPTGAGNDALAPPLAGSEWVLGPPENLIRIQLRGLKGSIKVKGRDYHFPAGMPAQAFQNDDQIAAVLTHIRNSWGNRADAVTPAMVAALRNEVGQAQLTVSDLTPPDGESQAVTAPAETTSAPPATTIHDDSDIPWIPIGIGLFVVLVCAIPIIQNSRNQQEE